MRSQFFNNSFVSVSFASVIALVFLLCVASAVPAVTIDNFDGPTPQQLLETNMSQTVNELFDGTAVAGLEVVGGYRDTYLAQSSPTATAKVTVNEAGMSGVYDLSFKTSTTGGGLLQYDGNSPGIAINPAGLGGEDFTEAGAHNRLNIHIPFNDHETTLSVTVYGAGDSVSKYTSIVPKVTMSDPTYVKSILFSEFTQDGAALNPANFASVGAVEIGIDGEIGGLGGLDMWLDLIQTTTGPSGGSAVPEPQTAVSLLIGSLGLCFLESFGVRRKRRRVR